MGHAPDGHLRGIRDPSAAPSPPANRMEERLLRAFAGLINSFGSRTWGSNVTSGAPQDDAKVRDSHAEYDDQVFRWNEPPAGGIRDRRTTVAVSLSPSRGGTKRSRPGRLCAHRRRVSPTGSSGARGRGWTHSFSPRRNRAKKFLRRAVSVDQFQSWLFDVYRKRHGSFSSIQAAQRLTNSNLSRNAEIVNDVATGKGDGPTSKVSFPPSLAWKPSARDPANLLRLWSATFGVGTVIEYAPDMPNGFIIITSYPGND